MTTKPALHSDLAIHPGEILAEELEARGLSEREVAIAMSEPSDVIHDICQGQKPISAAIAVKLEQVLEGPSAEYWLGLQTEYDLTLARASQPIRRARG